MSTASAELGAIADRLDREYPSRAAARGAKGNDRNWTAKSVTAFSTEDNSLRRFGLMLVGLVSLVLLVACTNLANLVLARDAARQGELAVRLAMGASRGRLVWKQCIENLLIAAAGAVASYVMLQAISAWMTTDFVMGLPFGGSATLSIRPAIDAQALTVAMTTASAGRSSARSKKAGRTRSSTRWRCQPDCRSGFRRLR